MPRSVKPALVNEIAIPEYKILYIVLRETGRGEKDERAPTGWLFGCTEPVKAEKSHRCAHSHAPALCRSQQHRHCFNM